MSSYLSLSRAARLVGVTRGELQQRIRRDELETFEGKVNVSDLLRAFPEARLEDDSTLERVNRIKAAATPEKEPKYELPAPEVLAERVNVLSHELTDARARLAGYAELVDGMRERLAGLGDTPDGDLRGMVEGLSGWLEEQMARRPREPRRSAALLAKDTFLRMLAAQVQVMPSGHEFFVEGAVSILDAGLRSGLALKYGCTAGNCGSCKARVVTGRVLKVRDHEYEISPREAEMGYILMCSNTAVTDVLIEAAEARGAADIPEQALEARLRRLDRPRPDLAVLHLQTPVTQRLRFLAGQEARLSLPTGAAADLPVACCPCDSQNLEFHVHRHPDTPFSRAIFDAALERGQSIRVAGPEGEPLEDRREGGAMIFVAREDGFSALKGFIENAISADNAERFRLVWVAGTAEGHYLDNLCRAWADALENFDYAPLTLEDGADAAAARVAEALADDPDLDTAQVYAAGTAPFTAALATRLGERGVAAEHLQVRHTP